MSEVRECPVCRSPDMRFVYSGRPVRIEWRGVDNFDVWQCNECSHRFQKNHFSFNELFKYYNSQYRPYLENKTESEIQEIFDYAKDKGEFRYIKIVPGMRILDIGCGGGLFLRVAQKFGASVQGIEPSEHGVSACKKNNIPVFHGDLDSFLATNPPKFDVVTLSHVLEHLPEPRSALKKILSLLDPSGQIFIAVPNSGSFFARTLKDRWHSSDLPVHFQHFTSKSLERLFIDLKIKNYTIKTFSENSLGHSVSNFLRDRFLLPSIISKKVTNKLFAKGSILGDWLDRIGQGDALIALASKDEKVG